MKKTGPVMAFVFLGLLIVGISVGSVASARNQNQLFGEWRWNTNMDSAELRNTVELDTTVNTKLEIAYGSDDVNLYQGDTEQLVIKEYLISNEEAAKAVVSQSDNIISIHGGSRKYYFNPLFWLRGSEHIDIYLPKQQLAGLQVEMKSGNLRSNVELQASEMDLYVSSGNVELNSMNTKKATLEVTSGNIDIKSIDTEEGRLDVKSGNITIRDYCGSLQAELTSGNLKLYVKEVTGDIQTTCRSGNINLYLPSDSAFLFDSRVGSGDVDVDFDGILYDKDNKNGQGTVGTNPNYQVSVDVSSGNIDIKKR